VGFTAAARAGRQRTWEEEGISIRLAALGVSPASVSFLQSRIAAFH
jgi:hypothetical protein